MSVTFSSSPFTTQMNPPIVIPHSAKIVFVADLFASEHLGGAELTSQALIDSSPLSIFKLHARDVTIELLRQGVDKHWIFGNFATLDFGLIPTIVGNMSYSILEYDYKYCRHRSPEKHTAVENRPCDCHNQNVGKYVSAFYLGAKTLWWMSEAQQQRYHTLFPFLAERDQLVLSSVFSADTLGMIKSLRDDAANTERRGWVRLESQSWIKGTDAARTWCETNNVEQLPIKSLAYDDVLRTLSHAEGLVYLPPGGDTCPRLVIEAKLLGCKLRLNDNVQHRYEEWFDTEDLNDIEHYLSCAPSIFWSAIKQAIDHTPTIDGYTTTFNCIKQGYPYRQCIESMLAFCNRVIVVDGGSTDGTWEILQELERDNPARLVAVSRPMDWSDARFAVFDGEQKAYARSLCKSDMCWQMDCDEVVHEDDVEKIKRLAADIPRGVDIISLPVIEYWGCEEKVRVDVSPWKWRLSRNNQNITHGIPQHLRRFDSDNRMYAALGTDGCDLIYKDSGEYVPHVNFYTPDIDVVRRKALAGDQAALEMYSEWFNKVVQSIPCVFHYSWYDLSRKIKLYREYWTKHWQSLYNQELVDTAENNYMFDAPWSDVTDAMIDEKAEHMRNLLGGWIWHKKWDGVTRTPSISIKRSQPRFMQTIHENVDGVSITPFTTNFAGTGASK